MESEVATAGGQLKAADYAGNWQTHDLDLNHEYEEKAGRRH